MGNNCYLYLLFLLWLSYLIISSVLLFARGFLLTRTVQRKNSTCLSHRDIPCSDNPAFQLNFDEQEQCSVEDKINSFITKYHSASSVCLPPRTRVVLLIVDALRYDFTVYDNKIENPLPFQNKLPIINQLLNQHADYSRLYKFVADPPTTTMQRLKAFTTGSLPTFIDAGSNFANSEIIEDNIVDQLLRHNHQVVFMGDDTWNGLYPNRFIRNFPYPSFNVWDLDTVDNGVKDHLFTELEKNDWSLLIGHLLGVDHCGHKYGPNHPEMTRKLGDINEIIEQVVSKINKSEDVILFVIGDHGMTSTGDHGGESEDEVTAAMFVYSSQILSSTDVATHTVKQVDLVPTLSTILGVPIPFQNLGILILDSLPIVTKNAGFNNWKFSMYSLWANVQQVFEYIKEYAENEGTFDEEVLKNFQQRYSVLNAKIIAVDNEDKFQAFSEDLKKFLLDLRQLCESLWVQFDSYSMARGLLFLFLTTFFVYVITDGITPDTLLKLFSSSYIFCSYAILVLSACATAIAYYFKLVDDLVKTIFFATGFCSQIMLALLVVQNWDIITSNWYSKSKINTASNVICRFVLALNIGGLFSNSYIIEESFVLLFLLVTVVLIGSIGITSQKIDTSKKKLVSKFWSRSKFKFIVLAVLVAVFVRGSAYYWRCRQEQQWCIGSYHEVGNNTKTETTKLQWTITVIFLGLFVFMSKEWLRNAGNMNGYSSTVTVAKFLPTTIVVCISGYWAMVRVSSHKKFAGSLNSVNSLAWSVYGLTSLGILVCLLKPLYTYVLPNKILSQDVNSIPALFKKLKNDITAQEKNNDDIPIVYGMGTLYSAAFVTIGVYLTLLFALLLGDATAPSAVIMFLTAAFILIVTSVLRIGSAENIDQLFDVPNISIAVWIILSQYFFYASGHQPSFPNISWEAAFIGTSGIFSNNFIPGTLIILNTFCSYVLMGVLLPLVLITPFTVFVMIPSLCEKKPDFRVDASRGEVLLFERDKMMMTSMFTLACKYILGHAIRVFASMLAATIHCRHLMVWSIFTPKLIFESIGMFVTLASVIAGYIILVRVNQKAEYLIQSINKMS
ncbi:GPI ethanolamine phosphate transferase 3 [Diorhabda carinulata]|uniref:GPI ethanolamine phosphate transferase 3 n=1 Tax=Diorhabda carinulata TaxID=1163345 RepID=UPI0025A2218C|nr:GPI ethanolamine phosphate transferase 3 [Diorhabda carinulata]